jgi:hypothetical protein
MTYRKPAQSGGSRGRTLLLAAVVVTVSATLIGLAASPLGKLRGDSRPFADPEPIVVGIGSQPVTPGPGGQGDQVRGDRSAPVPPDAEAGRRRDGATVLDEGTPAVANLDPALLGALRRAAADAAGDGVRFHVNSGWRSADHQAQLLRDAVSEYGSEGEAARWVATPEKSAHVSGDAVDIGPSDAAAWLSEHGADYGLCQIYRNEPWHYELRPDAADDGCPPMYADPTQDPRMW